jgi:outer membrane protein assembly factor BamB
MHSISTPKFGLETRVPRTFRGIAYPGQIGGKMQVVTSSEPTVAGYDAETGKELWKNDCMMVKLGLRLLWQRMVFAANEYATLAAIDPSNGSKVWENNEYLPELPVRLSLKDCLYCNKYGVLACYDAKSGTKHWEEDFGEGSTQVL